MFHSKRLMVVALPFAVMACGSEVTSPLEEFPVAWMVAGCSPVDGPAVDLYLGETEPTDVTQPTYPHIRLAVEAGAMELAGNSFSSQDNPSEIFVAQRCVDENRCVSATDAFVEFEDNGGSTVEYGGSLRVVFSDGSSVRGSFQAHLHALLILCG